MTEYKAAKLAPVMLLLVVIFLAGCSSDAGEAEQQSPSSAEATAAATTLPGGLKLPNNASIVDGPANTPTKKGATGWSAVATTPTGQLRGDVAAATESTITSAGYTISNVEETAEAITISSWKNYENNKSTQYGTWLIATITNPLPASGPAITYRSVTLKPKNN